MEGRVFFVTSLERTAGGRLWFASPAAAEIEVRGLRGQAMEDQVFVVTSFHQQNTSLLFGTCGLLDHLESNPSRFKRVPKNCTS